MWKGWIKEANIESRRMVLRDLFIKNAVSCAAILPRRQWLKSENRKPFGNIKIPYNIELNYCGIYGVSLIYDGCMCVCVAVCVCLCVEGWYLINDQHRFLPISFSSLPTTLQDVWPQDWSPGSHMSVWWSVRCSIWWSIHDGKGHEIVNFQLWKTTIIRMSEGRHC